MSQMIIISIISIISIGIIVSIFLYRNKTSSTSSTSPTPTTPIPTTPIPTTSIPTTPIPTTPIPTTPPIPAKSMPITFPPIPDITPIEPGIPNMNCETCMKNRDNIAMYRNKLEELLGNASIGEKVMKDEYLQYYSKYFDEFVKQGQSPDKIREHMISYINQIYNEPSDNFRNKIDKLLNDISNSRELSQDGTIKINESPITKQLCKNYC